MVRIHLHLFLCALSLLLSHHKSPGFVKSLLPFHDHLTLAHSCAINNGVPVFSTPPSLHDRKVIEVVSYDHENRRRERLTVKDSDNIKAPSRDAVPTDLQVRYTACRWSPPNIAELHTRGEDRGGHKSLSGARGLGYSMAQGLLESGISGLVIMDRNRELGEEAVVALSAETDIDIRFYKVDVRDEASTKEAISNAVSHFGTPHILVNSAGIAESNIKAEEYDIDKFNHQIGTNLGGTFVIAKTVGKAMIEAKISGSMIFIASMSGSIVNYPQNQCSYNASKAGVIQLAKNLVAERARYNIRVNAITPGYMDTALNRTKDLTAQKEMWIAQTPQKRLGRVDGLNGLAVFLASDASSFMAGANIAIDGGCIAW